MATVVERVEDRRDKPKPLADKRHYLPLDALRGVAAIAVLMRHVGDKANIPGLGTYGYLAVDLFFLLSGFVIAAAYERKMANGMSVIDYMVGTRLGRMYPMIILGSLLGLLAAPDWGDPTYPSWASFGKQLFMVPSKGPELFPLNPVMWSLLLELIINAAHAALYPYLTNRVLSLIVAIAAVALAVISWPYYNVNIGWGADNAIGGIARVCVSFPAGLVLYRLHAAGRIPKLGLPFAIIVSLIIAMLMVLIPEQHHLPMIHDLAAIFIVFPIVIIAGAQIELSGWLGRLAKWLGDLSYPLYAIHYPLVLLAVKVIGSNSISGAEKWAVWTGFCVGVVALAWLIDQWIEKPIQAWRKAVKTSNR
ncbi:acyltransferase family protein [Sphingomonas sp. Leaf226]|uniref:acyltransferase family protein n=1 Tax=Sphingomonas sp. Leaf226 TaxID=1735691 RepID=UPI0006F57ED9|nr:acyltransferase [Sphingomonas sp. Leaf226]KQM94194.1 hypothetical protein ASE77_19185 [Sphingomonas sp. Leaf226]